MSEKITEYTAFDKVMEMLARKEGAVALQGAEIVVKTDYEPLEWVIPAEPVYIKNADKHLSMPL